MAVSVPPSSCKVYTPDELATAIVESVGDTPSTRWLEPSHGHGAFLRGLNSAGVKKKRIVALDLDQQQSESDKLARTERGIDFLKWSSSAPDRFDRIVGNPPYVSIRNLSAELRESAANVHGPTGKPVGIGGNLWQSFVYASLRVLAPGGTLAFVLPSPAEFADYSIDLREAIRDKFEVLEVYRCRKPLFDDVNEGTVVAIARNYGKGPCRFRRKEFGTRDELIAGLHAGANMARRKCPKPCSSSPQTSLKLGDVATIRLGGVTGDSKYFLLTESQRVDLRLPVVACKPVVTRSKHLTHSAITTYRWRQLRDNNERVWLFDPPDSAIDHLAVQSRLHLSEKDGGCRRTAYKVSIRDPWYRTPLPKAPHGFISGMQSVGPWICMNETPRLNATNTLYTIRFDNSFSQDERYCIALSLMTSEVRKQLSRISRRYADGLLKYEPGALLSIRLPDLRQIHCVRSVYAETIAELLSGNEAEAKKIANDHFFS